MKTYTLEEAAKTTVAVLFEEACGDEPIVLVKGDKQVVLSAYQAGGQLMPDDYTEEELAVFRAFENASLEASKQAAHELLAE